MGAEDNNFIRLSNGAAECTISLFGGNLLSYRPKSQAEDVFWLGALNKFDNLQAVRGGIPVCWPRFAEEKLNSRFPRHGFARLSTWNLEKAAVDERKIEATLSLVPDEKFGIDVSARVFIKITDKLEYSLETINHGDEPFCFSEALHAYFNVGALEATEIEGLDGQRYRSSLDGQFYTQNGSLKINGEFDAAFVNHHGGVELIDKALGRVISLEKEGSDTTVVWNPNKDLAEMSPGQYQNFVCVEPANQGESFVTLPPHQTHKIAMTVKAEKLK